MYSKLIQINKLDFSEKKILVVGAGWMGDQYCKALSDMGILKVTVVSRSEESAVTCCRKYGYQPVFGGYQACLPTLGAYDLVVVATPVLDLMPAAIMALQAGNRNVLVEKPAVLFSDEITGWIHKIDQYQARVRVAFNRLAYPSLWKLKELIAADGGITSCRYTFTERVHTINFSNNDPDCYARWCISNSLHVIGMAHSLIGFPRQISSYHLGGFSWHPSGSRFVGSGLTHDNIPFSYHADWESAGRWGIEIMTNKNAYSLMPLEEIQVCPKGSFAWEKVGFESAYPKAKQGVAEHIAIMLDETLEADIPLADLAKTRDYLVLAESICNYSSSK